LLAARYSRNTWGKVLLRLMDDPDQHLEKRVLIKDFLGMQ
jgi:hypothetical protein